MKRGSIRLNLCFFLGCLNISIIYCPSMPQGRFHAFVKKTRATIKSWVYQGWVRQDNFFEVEPNELYRSSQMPSVRLEHYIKNHGIKTIINLSGDEPDYWISNDEKQLADKYEVVLFNMKTHALIVTPLDEVRSLLTIFFTAPLPILIHCFAGSDRTGEACALYKLVKNKNVSEAVEQLSSRFGHKKWLFPQKYYLITNLDKVYPNLLANLRQICSTRFSYNELKNIAAHDLYTKILEKGIRDTGESNLVALSNES